MNINELLEIVASENKLKIIAHFYNCTCKKASCVNDLKDELNLTQSNLSKHLTKLREEKVLDVTTDHKLRIYSINRDFKKEWRKILDPIINSELIKPFQCKHCHIN